jgi:CRP-like cAMP-binding protein
MQDVWHLGRIDWLRGLPEEQRERLHAAGAQKSHDAGSMVFTPERRPDCVYLLESGLVRIFRLSPSGGEVQFGHIQPGEIFGELSLFVDDPRESFAQAVQPSRVWSVPRETFLAVLKDSPSVMFEVSRQMGGRFKRIESRVEDLVFRSARSRLARILLQLADDFAEKAEAGASIAIPLTQSELAVMIGSTRQTVNASLAQMRDEGLLAYEGQHFTLLDAERLRAAAQDPDT